LNVYGKSKKAAFKIRKNQNTLSIDIDFLSLALKKGAEETVCVT